MRNLSAIANPHGPRITPGSQIFFDPTYGFCARTLRIEQDALVIATARTGPMAGDSYNGSLSYHTSALVRCGAGLRFCDLVGTLAAPPPGRLLTL